MSGDQKLPNKHCKTCSTNIEAKSAIFHCVACGECMHVTKKCTGMSLGAIMGISSIIQNVLLICQKCLELNKKDKILDVIVISRTEETISKLKKGSCRNKRGSKKLGTNLKRLKVLLKLKVYKPRQQNQNL